MRLVVKYGGNALAIGGDDPVLADVADAAKRGDDVVLVHGGGPQIDAALAERGIGERRIDGLRVTDAPTLAVTEQVLCATVNKALVRGLLSLGVRAVGVSGEDAAMLRSTRRDALGFVGAIPTVDTALIETLLAAGFLPVIAPLALDAKTGTPLNVNADEAAGAIAGALGADAYLVITNVDGVRANADDPQTTVRSLTTVQARQWLDDGTLNAGMRPKMRGALAAVEQGARRVLIAGMGENPLGHALDGGGTAIIPP